MGVIYRDKVISYGRILSDDRKLGYIYRTATLELKLKEITDFYGSYLLAKLLVKDITECSVLVVFND